MFKSQLGKLHFDCKWSLVFKKPSFKKLNISEVATASTFLNFKPSIKCKGLLAPPAIIKGTSI